MKQEIIQPTEGTIVALNLEPTQRAPNWTFDPQTPPEVVDEWYRRQERPCLSVYTQK